MSFLPPHIAEVPTKRINTTIITDLLPKISATEMKLIN